METYFWFLSITFFNQNLAWGTLKVCFTTLLKYIEVTKINCTLSKNAVLFCRALALCVWFFFFLFVYGCLTKHNHTEPSTSPENLWRNPRMWRTGRCTHYWWLQLGFPGIDEGIHGPIPNMFWFTFWHKTIWRP